MVERIEKTAIKGFGVFNTPLKKHGYFLVSRAFLRVRNGNKAKTLETLDIKSASGTTTTNKTAQRLRV